MPATDATAAYVAVALLAAGGLVWRTGWTWLAWLAAATTGPQLAILLDTSHAPALAGDPSAGRVLLLHALLLGWWAVLAVPVALAAVRHRTDALDPAGRALVSTLLGAVAGLAAIAYGDLQADGVGAVLVTLAVAHLAFAAGLVVLRRPAAREAALFVACLAGVAAVAAVASLAGGPVQPVLWAAEAAVYLLVARRLADVQAGVASALMAVLAVGGAVVTAPPVELASDSADPLSAAIAWGAVAVAAVWAARVAPVHELRGIGLIAAFVAGTLAVGIPLVPR